MNLLQLTNQTHKKNFLVQIFQLCFYYKRLGSSFNCYTILYTIDESDVFKALQALDSSKSPVLTTSVHQPQNLFQLPVNAHVPLTEDLH